MASAAAAGTGAAAERTMSFANDLGRYTQRAAIGAARLVAVRGEPVLLRVGADERGS